MVDREGDLVDGLSGIVSWGGAPTPADSIFWSEKFLHQKWAFIERVTPDIRKAFRLDEE